MNVSMLTRQNRPKSVVQFFPVRVNVHKCVCVCIHVSIIQLSVYRGERNVGQFPFDEKKKWMLVFPETAPTLDPLKLKVETGWKTNRVSVPSIIVIIIIMCVTCIYFYRF